MRPFLVVLILAIACGPQPPSGKDDASATASSGAWFEDWRELDLTGDGRPDRVHLVATGSRSDSLHIVLTMTVDGKERWREEWESDYHLVDPPEFAGPPERDEYIRTELEAVMESVRVEPFDLQGYTFMAEKADSAVIRTPPQHQVMFSYGYETTAFLRWLPERQAFELLYACC